MTSKNRTYNELNKMRMMFSDCNGVAHSIMEVYCCLEENLLLDFEILAKEHGFKPIEDGLSKDDLINMLNFCGEGTDEEVAKFKADNLLLAYINDPEIKEAYDKVDKWYA